MVNELRTPELVEVEVEVGPGWWVPEGTPAPVGDRYWLRLTSEGRSALEEAEAFA